MAEQGSAIQSAAGFARRLGWFGVVLGVCLIILGLIVLIRPGASLLLLAILVGIQLMFLGVVRVISALTSKTVSTVWRVLVIIAGVLTAIVGIICLLRPEKSLSLLAILVGIGWLIDGVATIVSAFLAPRKRRARVSQVIFGLCSLIAGIIVIVWPEKSLVVMTQLVGVILIVLGVLAISVALPQVRAKDEPAAGTPARP
ncbi:HdeD family acid-resistance protein [Microlunatus elymi]|uniref:HdeD family acid-resistance protein n=1 Tax=Microlunatus elymi TaxID=2596828 RepID=A0A516PZZ6_9ACTN|nr:DUF308 domain-containing protein [Microlunatus elymi]QDP96712.1 HdeD family acid-resistance protein [Microlunatus elymi]